MDKQLAILCVDDEKSVLVTLIRQLESKYGERFQYESAESVEDAWYVINDLINDGYSMVLVISDWLMPGIRGDEFLVQLHKHYPETVKIMLSGQADPAAVRNAIQNANCHFVEKPWNIDVLTKHIDAFLASVSA